MGFSLLFMRIENGEIADADHQGLNQFLTQQGLQIQSQAHSGGLVDQKANSLTFDGSFTDLHLDPLDQTEPVTGGIDHATLSEDECQFIYNLCVAGKMMIINPQGDPTYVIPQHNHIPQDIPDVDDAIWVNSAEELYLAFSKGFEAFKHFKEKVIGQYHQQNNKASD